MQCLGSAWINFLCMRRRFGKKVRWTPVSENFSAGETIEFIFRPERSVTISLSGHFDWSYKNFKFVADLGTKKNFIWQKFSEDRSKLITKVSIAKELTIFFPSSNTMYLKIFWLQSVSRVVLDYQGYCNAKLASFLCLCFQYIRPKTLKTFTWPLTSIMEVCFDGGFLTNNRTCKQQFKQLLF